MLSIGELLGLVNYAEQFVQGRVDPLKIAPADAYLSRPVRVHVEFDPGGPDARVHGLRPDADEHLWLKALDLRLKCLHIGGLYLRARA